MKDLERTKFSLGLQIEYLKNDFFYASRSLYNKVLPCEKLSYLFTKTLSSKTFEQLIHKINLHRLQDACLHEGEK
ncbi:hypothetical protein CR513_62301, partial [Mucuna pruriens]